MIEGGAVGLDLLMLDTQSPRRALLSAMLESECALASDGVSGVVDQFLQQGYFHNRGDLE